jgi:hypothetical protein
MPATQVFDFDPARLEGQFSDMQPVNDSVQRAESATAGCCRRTRVTICSQAAGHGYVLELPLKGKQPNESPLDPPSNHFAHVMTAQVKPPMLQVLSGHSGNRVVEITTTAEGPPQCPPGVDSKLRLEGLGGGTRVVPQIAWNWPAPAILNAELMEELDEEMLSLFNPFKMPELPAQVWSVDLPRCALALISARIAAFPDIRWAGRLEVSTKPSAESSSGYELLLGGDLGCSYDGRQWKVHEKQQAKALCKWIDGLEVLARSAAAIMALRPGPRHAGLDNPRLTRMETFRFHPWPSLSIHLDASLFEQEGNGLLGHSLRMKIQAAPLIGASGEMSLLGPWLEQADKIPLLSPLLAGLDVIRAEEIAQELGIWLVADGHISLQAGIEVRRPQTQVASVGRSQGEIPLRIETRSIREYDSFVIHQGGSEDSGHRAGFRAACAAPAESPMPDPREHKPKAAFQFTGLQVTQMEKSRPGCRFRFLQPEPSENASEEGRRGCLLAPSRSWPADATVESPAEVPWCS